jgi:hypothetical protein
LVQSRLSGDRLGDCPCLNFNEMTEETDVLWKTKVTPVALSFSKERFCKQLIKGLRLRVNVCACAMGLVRGRRFWAGGVAPHSSLGILLYTGYSIRHNRELGPICLLAGLKYSGKPHRIFLFMICSYHFFSTFKEFIILPAFQ